MDRIIIRIQLNKCSLMIDFIKYEQLLPKKQLSSRSLTIVNDCQE